MMRKKIAYLLSILTILMGPSLASAFVEGTYYSESQSGMYVHLETGAWALYIPTGDGGSQIFDGGTYSIQGTTIIFQSNYGKNEPPATITGNCSFSWGQSGNFINQDCGSSTYQGTTSQANQSSFSEGTYASTSQQGMYVVFQGGQWALYIMNNNGQAVMYDGGVYSIQGNSIVFQSSYGKSEPTATILNSCSFSWGQSGNFVSQNCGSGQGTTTGSGAGTQQVDPADYIPIVAILQQGVYFYIPQLGIPYGNSALFLEVISQLVDPNNITFMVSDYDVITDPKGYISALYAPNYSVIYCPYVVLIVQGQQPTILQNIFFQLLADQAGNIYLKLYNIYGDSMPTYSQYSSGQYGGGYSGGSSGSGYGSGSGSSGYDPTMSNMYFNTMNDILNTMHETSMTIIDNINPSPQWDYDYDY